MSLRCLPSRRMPPVGSVEPETPAQSIVRWGCLVLFLATLMPMICSSPAVLIFIGVVALLVALAAIFSPSRPGQKRPGESICTFVRQFDWRTVDTWVLRAVYEELESYANGPVRREDGLLTDLAIDEEDLLDNCALSIAWRSGRSVERCEENPYFSRVQTVDDLVQFFLHQPRRNDR